MGGDFQFWHAVESPQQPELSPVEGRLSGAELVRGRHPLLVSALARHFFFHVRQRVVGDNHDHRGSIRAQVDVEVANRAEVVPFGHGKVVLFHELTRSADLIRTAVAEVEIAQLNVLIGRLRGGGGAGGESRGSGNSKETASIHGFCYTTRGVWIRNGRVVGRHGGSLSA